MISADGGGLARAVGAEQDGDPARRHREGRGPTAPASSPNRWPTPSRSTGGLASRRGGSRRVPGDRGSGASLLYRRPRRCLDAWRRRGRPPGGGPALRSNLCSSSGSIRACRAAATACVARSAVAVEPCGRPRRAPHRPRPTPVPDRLAELQADLRGAARRVPGPTSVAVERVLFQVERAHGHGGGPGQRASSWPRPRRGACGGASTRPTRSRTPWPATAAPTRSRCSGWCRPCSASPRRPTRPTRPTPPRSRCPTSPTPARGVAPPRGGTVPGGAP